MQESLDVVTVTSPVGTQLEVVESGKTQPRFVWLSSPGSQ